MEKYLCVFIQDTYSVAHLVAEYVLFVDIKL